MHVSVAPAKPTVSWNGTSLSTVNGYSGYQWYLNGNALLGATTSVYTPTTTGSYKVFINNFYCNPTSDEFSLSCNVVSVSKPVISWSGYQLSVGNAYNSYQWYFNNNPIPNATNFFTIISQTGVYKVTVTGQLGCASTSNDFTITCNEAGPARPPINWNGVQFSTNTGYAGYQWFYNDTAIAGATAYIYSPLPAKFGRYKVEVTNGFNCSSVSDEKFYSPTAIVSVGQAKFSWYPNPVRETFYIDVLQNSTKTMTASLYDLNGKKILQQSLKQGQNQVRVKGISVGMYLLEIRSGGEKTQLKLAVVQ